MSDSVAFSRLFHAHKQRVFHWALRYGGGRRAFAEDVVQEVFMRAYESWASLESHQDLAGWLYRVTANAAISRLRRERYSLRRLRLWIQQEVDEPRVELLGDGKRAVAAIDALPPQEKVVLTMKLLDGLSNREVARALELSDGYVTKLTQKAISRLRQGGWEGVDADP